MITNQEAFNKVVISLRKQGRKSRVTLSNGFFHDRCVYRGPNGLKCGAGHLIPDELYKDEFDNEFEDSSIRNIVSHYGEEKVFGDKIENINFIAQLQKIHDNYRVSIWEEEFARLAQEFNLTVPPIQES